MSAIDFGVDHKFYPAGRTPDELAVGFLVANPDSPSDFIPLFNVPPSVKTETLNPTAGLTANRKDAIDAHLKSFLDVHYNIKVSNGGDIKAVKMVRERLNNISSAKLKEMLGTESAIAFLKRIAEERAQRSKIGSWKNFLFKHDPWLVVSTHTFYESKSNANTGTTVEMGVEGTAPVVTALTHGASDDGNRSIGFQHEDGSTTTQSGHSVQPLVFAAKFRQVRYKLVDDHLTSCYLLPDKAVFVGFFGGENSDSDNDPIKSEKDIVAFIQNGDIEIEWVDDGAEDLQGGANEGFFGAEFYSKARCDEF
jgi:hypothetical protein